MENEDVLLRDAGFVIASKIRTSILKLLAKSPAIPSQLSDKLNLQLSHTSRALSELECRGLILCVNPNHTKGRVYRLTEQGREVLKRTKLLY